MVGEERVPSSTRLVAEIGFRVERSIAPFQVVVSIDAEMHEHADFQVQPIGLFFLRDGNGVILEIFDVFLLVPFILGLLRDFRDIIFHNTVSNEISFIQFLKVET